MFFGLLTAILLTHSAAYSAEATPPKEAEKARVCERIASGLFGVEATDFLAVINGNKPMSGYTMIQIGSNLDGMKLFVQTALPVGMKDGVLKLPADAGELVVVFTHPIWTALIRSDDTKWFRCGLTCGEVTASTFVIQDDTEVVGIRCSAKSVLECGEIAFRNLLSGLAGTQEHKRSVRVTADPATVLADKSTKLIPDCNIWVSSRYNAHYKSPDRPETPEPAPARKPEK